MIFKPDTLLRWHRDLVKKKWTFANTPERLGRSPTEPELIQFILRIARENQWGEAKIEGELKKLGYRVSHETIRKVLRSHGVPPMPTRRNTMNWRTFLNHCKDILLTCDFITVETIALQTSVLKNYVNEFARVDLRFLWARSNNCSTMSDQTESTEGGHERVWSTLTIFLLLQG